MYYICNYVLPVDMIDIPWFMRIIYTYIHYQVLSFNKSKERTSTKKGLFHPPPSHLQLPWWIIRRQRNFLNSTTVVTALRTTWTTPKGKGKSIGWGNKGAKIKQQVYPTIFAMHCHTIHGTIVYLHLVDSYGNICNIDAHSIHGTGIFTYVHLPLKSTIHVGKYTFSSHGCYGIGQLFGAN